MSDVTLRVLAGFDLTTERGVLDQPYAIEWSRERFDVGAGSFVIPHDSPAVQAAPALLDEENVVIVVVDGEDRFPWVVRRRQRRRGDVWDPIQVTGVGALALLDQAVVYMWGGLAGPPSDKRVFAWMAHDYQLGDGWGEPVSLGQYRNPTDPSLQNVEPVEGANEVQRVILDADSPPFPWGSSYPSPGGLGGTWRLSFRGKWTGAIPWDASAGQVRSALMGLSNIDDVTVTGSGTSSDPWLVEFAGANVSERQHPVMGMAHSDLRHSHATSGVRRVTSGHKSVEGEEIVEDWPDPRAEWFGEYGDRQHYRRVLDAQAAGVSDVECYLHVVSLGPVDVWWDGEHLGDGDELDLLVYRVDLIDSQHVLGIRAQAPTMVSVIEHLGGDELGRVLYRSFTPAVYGGPGSPEPWVAYGPDAPPGVTPGFILATLFDNAQDRGYLPALSIDFDGEVDSLGREWPKRTELGLQVGDDTVLSAAERLRDLDVWLDISPDLTVHAFAGPRVDRGTTPDDGVDTTTVGLEDARDVGIQTEDEVLNAFLVRSEDAWQERHLAVGDRREGFLSLGMIPSVERAADIGDELVEDFTSSRELMPWTISSAQDVAQPEDDYALGDVIVGPRLPSITGEWEEGDVQVDTIAARVDAVGDIDWTHETSRQ